MYKNNLLEVSLSPLFLSAETRGIACTSLNAIAFTVHPAKIRKEVLCLKLTLYLGEENFIQGTPKE